MDKEEDFIKFLKNEQKKILRNIKKLVNDINNIENKLVENMICPECHSILIEQEYWDEKFYECVNCNYLVNIETGEKDAKIF